LSQPCEFYLMVPRIHFHCVRTQYQPAAILEQPLLVFSVSREMPDGGQFQGQTCSDSCEDFKNPYIWYLYGSISYRVL
jgi:hypothetical protein